MRAGTGLALLLAASLVRAPSAGAQSTAQTVEQGIEAYRVLDLNAAAGLLRRALAAEPPDTLEASARIRALTYLGATELFREDRDSALSAFRRIVRLNPRYVIDELEFPPEVTALFQLARRDTKVVVASLPATARVEAGSGIYSAQLFASSFHRIAVALNRPDGTAARVLYQGVIGDSLEVVWNGLDGEGSPLEPGRYVLRVESTAPDGTLARVLRVPLEITAEVPDTIAHPPPPADSLFLPETIEDRQGTRALAAGLIAGVGVAVLPFVVAPDAGPSAARFAVGGAITVAGVVGFFARRPGRAVPQNMQANELLRANWQSQRDDVVRQNRARMLEVTLVIRAGRPSTVDAEGS